ncbi:DUF5681 domain-containing protein [Nitrobacter sp.]|uniref:DUF5681 domain-containing protein n=1 Tax=Nitrobacter sp. TaxID=29420 RepID=UPI0029CAB97F|nr:DUF5681 domain-containing protein [Nitrobacter sp.]
MRKPKRSKPASYAVGYRRPPKASQFEKGVSGNPRGRPKGRRTVGALLQEILGQKIAVTENGRTRRLPALEVILRRLVNDAMRSEPRALKLLLALYDRYGESPESDLRLDEILAEDREILASFLDRQPGNPDVKAKLPSKGR